VENLEKKTRSWDLESGVTELRRRGSRKKGKKWAPDVGGGGYWGSSRASWVAASKSEKNMG